MRPYCILFAILAVTATALPVSDDFHMLTDDASHDAYNVQTSALESQKASEHQASQLMNHVLQKQAEEHSRSAAAMHAAARSQLTKQSFSVDDSHAHVEEISLSMTSFNRAFSSIDQYDFSSCWGNDAVGQGHCRPQIDSPQGWSSKDGLGWMSINLKQARRVAGIVIQGRSSSCNCNQFVTRVRIFTSPNGIDWIDRGSFTANSDQDSKVNILFSQTTVAQYVKMVPLEINAHSSARWDVLVSNNQESLVMDMPQYFRANPLIDRYAFSSCWNGDAPNSGHCRPQIDSPQGWSSQTSSSGWSSIDLTQATRVAGIVIQGRHNCDQWLTRVRISTSPNGWDWIDRGEFSASSDQNTLKSIILAESTVCRFVRIDVVSVYGHASARWDVLKTADQSSLVMEKPKYFRANPQISQYAFHSCWDGDAPNSGHCRPQIDSPQGWSNWKGLGWSSINLNSLSRIAGVLIQGRNSACGCNQWVTRLLIATSADNVNWIHHGTFAGNSDQDSKVQLLFDKPIVARFVRITPIAVNGHPSARWDALLSADQTSLVAAQPKNIRANPLISQYIFSSCWGGDAPNSGHCRPQIDSPQVGGFDSTRALFGGLIVSQGWSSREGNGWMIIDLKEAKKVSGVMTQGRNADSCCAQWVTRFSIDHSLDQSNWVSLGQFPANTDTDTQVDTIFSSVITARFVRINVIAFNNHPSMRWDVLSPNPNGQDDDGSNLVPVGSNAVKTADIAKVILSALDKNLAVLQESQAQITKVYNDAIEARDTAQALYNDAETSESQKKNTMEQSSALAAEAKTQCTEASQALVQANSALSAANAAANSLTTAADKEINIIQELKGKLVELTNVKLQTSDLQTQTDLSQKFRQTIIERTASFRQSSLAELMVGLEATRDHHEIQGMHALLDQLLAKLIQQKQSALNSVQAATQTQGQAATAQQSLCETANIRKDEATAATAAWNTATDVLQGRLNALNTAKTEANSVTTAYNTAKASFDSEVATMNQMKLFHSGQLVCQQK